MTQNFNMDVVNLSGKSVGKVDLPQDLFGRDLRADLLQRAVTYQLASVRAGLAKTLTRGEIDRSKKKWFRQKGSGRARHGARSSNIFVGGGTAFGPSPRDFSISLPKKVRALAIKVALSTKFAGQKLIVVDKLELETPKTKAFIANLKALGVDNAAFIIESWDTNFDLASRNVPHLKVLPTEGANVYDILRHDVLITTPGAIKLLEQRLSTTKDGAEAKAAAKPVKAAAAKAPKAEAKEPAAKAAAPKAAAKKPAAKATKE
jgi:large subunit ribosomal protein L4